MTTRILSILLVTSLSAIGAAGYCRPLLSDKLFGSLALGYSLVVGLYCFCWAMAICCIALEISPSISPRSER